VNGSPVSLPRFRGEVRRGDRRRWIGGLACGALLAAEGLEVLVVERHDSRAASSPTTREKGYRFQVPHLVGGCGPGGYLARVMDHLGITFEFKRVDPYVRFVYPEHDISVPSDAEAFKQLLKENFQPRPTTSTTSSRLATRVYKAMDVRMFRKPRPAASTLKAAAYPLVYPRMVALEARGRTLQQLLDSYFTEDRIKAVLATTWPFLGAPPWELSALDVVDDEELQRGSVRPFSGYGALADGSRKRSRTGAVSFSSVMRQRRSTPRPELSVASSCSRAQR